MECSRCTRQKHGATASSSQMRGSEDQMRQHSARGRVRVCTVSWCSIRSSRATVAMTLVRLLHTRSAPQHTPPLRIRARSHWWNEQLSGRSRPSFLSRGVAGGWGWCAFGLASVRAGRAARPGVIRIRMEGGRRDVWGQVRAAADTVARVWTRKRDQIEIG